MYAKSRFSVEKSIVVVNFGDLVLSWMMENIHGRPGLSRNIKSEKMKVTEKIDGAVALIMALDRCIRNESEGEKSVNGERGLLI